jgi:hypothetical protein
VGKKRKCSSSRRQNIGLPLPFGSIRAFSRLDDAHPDWIFLLDPQVQLSIYSRNALTDTPRNNALPVIWVSPDPVKLTYKINHCTPCCPLPNLLHLRQELRTQKQSLKPSEEKALPLILPHLLGFRFQVSVCRKAQQDAGESVPTKAWLQQDHEGQEMR